MSFRLVFDPIAGSFELRKVQVQTVAGSGGGSILSGTLYITTGTTLLIQNEIQIGAGGEILLDSGADLFIE